MLIQQADLQPRMSAFFNELMQIFYHNESIDNVSSDSGLNFLLLTQNKNNELNIRHFKGPTNKTLTVVRYTTPLY